MGFAPTDIIIAMGALLGVLTAIEHRRGVYAEGDAIPRRLAALVVAGMVAIGIAESVRGFLYLVLMPIGAYKVAQVVAAPFAGWWIRRRGP